jgi:RIO kinase 1
MSVSSVSTDDVPEVFFTDGWITAVEGLISSGKEGTVFTCLAASHTGHERLAVKIHRSRDHRSFKNDAIYLSGRAMGVSLDGRTGVKSSGRPDRRLQRAMKKRSRRGKAAIEHSWIQHEYNTLQLLHGAGARVPQPFAISGHALLMEFVGDASGPAPMLKHATLTPSQATRVFHGLVAEIELWLSCERIHGDLSPFNILFWNDRAVVIDFPQAVNPTENPDSLFLLERDVRNVCAHFADLGVPADPARIAQDLWSRFMRGDL